jgi:hypothetical protein
MNRQPSYKIYATLLDAFYNYLNSDVIYDRYWGFSENPPFTEEEFQQKQFKELIDRVNRVPFDSEDADRGTAFNEVVDCLVEHRKSDKMKVEYLTAMVEDYKDPSNIGCAPRMKEVITGLECFYNKRKFDFPLKLCQTFADYFKGALTQQRVEAVLHTGLGDVLVYGVIDELMPTSVHDIKTVKRYDAFKFKSHFQHLVYPYALIQNGNDIHLFEYDITDFKDTYTESYVFVPERDIPILTSYCEDFIRFLEENRYLITDKKIYGGEKQ